MRGEFVDLDGVRLYCYAFGSRGVGDPIVLVHGAFTSSHLWQDVLPRLPKGHRVLVLDLLGHGRSDPPRAASMTIGAHADRLGALLDVMGVGVATLVGHGMGAAICARLAHVRPERVARLALVNPALLARDVRDASVSRRMTRLAALVPLWRRLSPSWLASSLHAALLPAFAQRSTGIHSLDLYLKGFRTREGRDAACAQLRAFSPSRAEGARGLLPNALACPVTLTLGDSDPFMAPAKAARLQAALLEATAGRSVVHRLPSVAHMAPEEAPDRLGAMVGELLTR
jgi:pimeloyl-ACP methyl ester carboxylesterase